MSGFAIGNTTDAVINTRGDIAIGGSTGLPENLALGTAGKVLSSNGTDISWNNTSTVVVKSADYTITETVGNLIVLVNSGNSANVTIKMPDAVSHGQKTIKIVKADTGTKFVAIARAGSDVIRGSATSLYLVLVGESAEFTSNGTGWILMGDPYRTISAEIAVSGTPTITRQDGVWISGLTDLGTGYTRLDLFSGVFLSSPNLTATSTGANVFPRVIMNSSTAVSVATADSGGSAADKSFNVICVGRK